MTIVETALSVGFQTQAHFTTAFKRFVGHTPCQWRAASAPLDTADISISPASTVMAKPNTAASNQSNPIIAPPANATGAAVTPGVWPPSGC